MKNKKLPPGSHRRTVQTRDLPGLHIERRTPLTDAEREELSRHPELVNPPTPSGGPPLPKK